MGGRSLEGSPPISRAGVRCRPLWLMTLAELIILALAVYRLTRLVIDDTISQPVRSWILSHWPGREVSYDATDKVRGGTFMLNGVLYAVEPTVTGDRLAKLLSCYWCASPWIALIVTVAFWLWPFTVWLLLPFTLSAVTGLLADR
jgi:hypothetical protein